MGLGTDGYNLLLLLHLAAVVAGIGTVTLNGLRASKTKRLGGQAAGAAMAINLEMSNLAEKIIYLIPVTGVALVLASEGIWSLRQAWLYLSLVLWFAALGIAHVVMLPAVNAQRAIGARLAAGGATPPDIAARARHETRLAMGGMAMNLLAVANLSLMIWKPGI